MQLLLLLLLLLLLCAVDCRRNDNDPAVALALSAADALGVGDVVPLGDASAVTEARVVSTGLGGSTASTTGGGGVGRGAAATSAGLLGASAGTRPPAARDEGLGRRASRSDQCFAASAPTPAGGLLPGVFASASSAYQMRLTDEDGGLPGPKPAPSRASLRGGLATDAPSSPAAPPARNSSEPAVMDMDRYCGDSDGPPSRRIVEECASDAADSSWPYGEV